MQAPPSHTPPPGPTRRSHRRGLAFGVGLSVGVLGGLLGLGGAEFRLPALVVLFGYGLRQAIPLNLATSLITLAVSLAARSRTLSLVPVIPYAAAVGALLVGSLAGALTGPRIAQRLSNERLRRLVVALLVLMGGLLVAESFVPGVLPALLPQEAVVWVCAGVGLGLGIGLVSSLLGVAGGELLIPTLVFGYGVDVKSAGTASVLIALPSVAAGVARWARVGGLSDRAAVRGTVVPMGLGSVLGAFAGSALARVVPAELVKLLLGLLLVTSALRAFRRAHGESVRVQGKAPAG
ncbi:MAG: sulfite exporter TauE/SafE family protein [Armatimonadota bacterium]|nr:sulfite exporter TauE/SafE family protein [Armatimonadota bacterium]MDR7449840.1 sulfite exporter TauE/SafE family protein [Armatimonadota bacterium]MDR7459120.1 sulfite exporter TauE/SafE family protein [Armatimonadota bacterium]MDR7480394.1 sulfite exporter TauE/SafE family protein [Armatimonadota bacterium]MDR7489404.1 sulfite exporter TauE/SafE family protein [Armatimonadota bacterium]